MCNHKFHLRIIFSCVALLWEFTVAVLRTESWMGLHQKPLKVETSRKSFISQKYIITTIDLPWPWTNMLISKTGIPSNLETRSCSYCGTRKSWYSFHYWASWGKEEKPAEKKPKKEKAAKKGKTEKSTGGTQTEGTRLVLRSYEQKKFLCLVV